MNRRQLFKGLGAVMAASIIPITHEKAQAYQTITSCNLDYISVDRYGYHSIALRDVTYEDEIVEQVRDMNGPQWQKPLVWKFHDDILVTTYPQNDVLIFKAALADFDYGLQTYDDITVFLSYDEQLEWYFKNVHTVRNVFKRYVEGDSSLVEEYVEFRKLSV